MRLLCYNINGLPATVANAALKYGSWKGFFDEHKLDIACLQEAKVPEDKLTKEMCCVDGFQSFWACSVAKKGYSGVTTYCSTQWDPLSCQLDSLSDTSDKEELSLSGEGRVVLTDHGAFILINVYVPNAGDSKDRPRLEYKLRFLKALHATCKALVAAGREVLVVGDFNVCAAGADVHPNIKVPYTEEERALLSSFTSPDSPENKTCTPSLQKKDSPSENSTEDDTKTGRKGEYGERRGLFTDVWRELHPDTQGVYTVWDEKTSARAFNEGVRIDYVLATAGLLPHIVSCEILGADVLPPKWSDHAGIILELSDEIAPPPAHAPCKEWVKLNKRFNDPSQRSIMSMFGKKKVPAKVESAGKEDQVGEKRAAEVSSEVAAAEPVAKQTKRDV